MTATTYRHCYRVLGIAGDCEWEELRLAYRRRVRRCHPDLLATDAGGVPHDEEFKDVVKAYRQLAGFRRRHGELPPPWLAISDEGKRRRNVAERTHAPRGSHTVRERLKVGNGWRVPLPRFHRAVLMGFVASVATAALLERANPPAATASVLPLPDARLSVGMDPQTVVNVQGVPSRTKGSVWFYGESGVIFERGCVIGWENQPPFPLRTLVGVTYLATHAAAGARGACPPTMQ